MAQTKQKPKPITAAQIRRILTICHILGVSDENYRECLQSRFGVTTCKDLTVQEAKSFLDELEKLALNTDRERYQAKMEEAAKQFADKQPKKFDNLDNRPGMASGAQLRLIDSLWEEISIIPEAAPRARALRRFVQRIASVAHLNFLDGPGATKVINAMKAMQKSSAQKTKNAA